MTKNIIFVDFNWVISHKDFWYSLKTHDTIIYEKINTFLFINNKQLVQDRMLWKYSSTDICQILSNKLNLDYHYIYQTLINDCKNIDLSNTIKNALQELKNKYIIVLITDNMDCFSEITKNNTNYFSIFDEIFNSAKKWYFKTDAYIEYITKYKANICFSYLIDDSTKNCEIFKKLWWKVINEKDENIVISKIHEIKTNNKS